MFTQLKGQYMKCYWLLTRFNKGLSFPTFTKLRLLNLKRLISKRFSIITRWKKVLRVNPIPKSLWTFICLHHLTGPSNFGNKTWLILWLLTFTMILFPLWQLILIHLFVLPLVIQKVRLPFGSWPLEQVKTLFLSGKVKRQSVQFVGIKQVFGWELLMLVLTLMW